MLTTIAIPTHNRPELVRHAIASAAAQDTPCKVRVVDAGGHAALAGVPCDLVLTEDPGPYEHWRETVLGCDTRYVNLLHDDDWLEPSFVRRAERLLLPDVAYVFSQATICWEDGIRALNLPSMPGEDGFIAAHSVAEILAIMPYTISPCSILFRRTDLLTDLTDVLRWRDQGKLFRPRRAGYDKLLALLPLLRYGQVGFIGEPLVNFRHHVGSDTVESQASAEGNAELLADYRDAVAFFRRLQGEA